jgi:hypothetical protein
VSKKKKKTAVKKESSAIIHHHDQRAQRKKKKREKLTRSTSRPQIPQNYNRLLTLLDLLPLNSFNKLIFGIKCPCFAGKP